MAIHKRKKLYIDPKVQFALLLQTVLHWAIFLSATFALLFYLQILTGDPYQSFSHHLSQMWNRHAPSFVVFLVLTPIVIRDSIKLSNRVAGPIYRMRVTLEKMVKGEFVEPIHFRKGDFWQDLAKDFNIIIDRLQTAQPKGPELLATENTPREKENPAEPDQVPVESSSSL